MLGYTLTAVTCFALGWAFFKHRQVIRLRAESEAQQLRVLAVAKIHGVVDHIKAAL